MIEFMYYISIDMCKQSYNVSYICGNSANRFKLTCFTNTQYDPSSIAARSPLKMFSPALVANTLIVGAHSWQPTRSLIYFSPASNHRKSSTYDI